MLRMPHFTACFLLLFAIAKTNISYAGVVTEVKEDKKTITIDEGESKGFTKGVGVCFFNDKNKKVGCGKVKSAKSSEAVIKVTKKVIKKVKTGFTASLKDAKGGASGAVATAPKTLTMRFFSVFAPINDYTYNKIHYEVPTGDSAEAPETLWVIDEARSLVAPFTNFGLELELNKLSLAAGFRYNLLDSFTKDSDYDLVNKAIYSSTSVTSTSINAYLDYSSIFHVWLFHFGVGVNIDKSTVTLTMDKIDESGSLPDERLYSAVSDLMVIGLRIPVRINIGLDSFGLAFALTPILPLVGSPPTPVVTFSDPADPNSELISDPELDIKTQLGHNKATFGLDISLGAFYAF